MSSHLVLGTAGHIDHGKSSLVKRLTGSDPDRLPEEKARGVTIELGFAHMSLADDSHNYEIGIVDVPGHADFVNNMVAGVGALDLAIFVIAADDGWMPQSEEHLHILTYLGIKNIVIAMTKADLCEDVPFSIEVLRDELQNTSIADAPIIPVSSITGEGIDDLKQELLDQLKDSIPQEDCAKPRLAIDRIFSPKGTGTVVTGTLSGGKLNVGDTLTLQPLGLETKVRYIQNHNQSLETAFPGMRTALNLPDLPIAAPGKNGAHRGDTLTSPNIGETTRTLDILLTRIARPIPGYKPRPIRNTETVVIHHGSARCHARVILHDRSQLHPGESCLAQLRMEEPLFLLTGDHIVLRDGAQQSTLAGATVLDALSTRAGFRNEAREAFLSPRAEAPNKIESYLTSLLTRDHLIHEANSLPNNSFSANTLNACIAQMLKKEQLTRHAGLLLDAIWWQDQLKVASKLINQWHQKHPDIPLMPLDELAQSMPHIPSDIFAHLPSAMEQKGFQITKQGLASARHTLTLPDDLAPAAENILKTLNQSALQPPNKAELANNPKSQQAMTFLIRSGQVVELEPKVVISAQTRDSAMEQVKEFITTKGQATASELRQHLDTSRKVVMPLLEHFDNLGVTARFDNFRKLV